MLFPEFKNIGVEEFLSILAALSLVILIIHYFLAYWPVAALKTTLSSPESPDSYREEPVSVIICAKNEDENLTEFLPKVLTQEYSEFEVIVVNDCSWDNT